MPITLIPVPNVPKLRPGDDLAAALIAACDNAGLAPADNDVLVLAQKIVSKTEGRYVDLATVEPSERARTLGGRSRQGSAAGRGDPARVARVVRHRPGVLIVEHRLGFIMANAGVDRSNVDPDAGQEPVLLLPVDPDASAAALRDRLGSALRRARWP